MWGKLNPATRDIIELIIIPQRKKIQWKGNMWSIEVHKRPWDLPDANKNRALSLAALDLPSGGKDFMKSNISVGPRYN